VAGSCEYGDEPSGSGAMELVDFNCYAVYRHSKSRPECS
jgi:hypothetical protein